MGFTSLLCVLAIVQWSRWESPVLQAQHKEDNYEQPSIQALTKTTEPPRLVTQPRSAPTASPSREPHGLSTPEAAVATVFEPLVWEGGGVSGPTAHSVRQELDDTLERVQSEVHSAACGALLEDRDSEAWVAALGSLHEVLHRLVDNFTKQGFAHDDCWIHLTPHQRAMCIVLASIDDDGSAPNSPRDEIDTNRRTSLPLHRRRAYLASYCSTMVPCLQWKAGRFSLKLNATFLEDVYANAVVPHVLFDDENRQAVDAVNHVFSHDERNVDVEIASIINRTLLQEEWLGKHAELFDAFQRELDHEKKHRQEPGGSLPPLVPTEAERKALEWAREPVDGLTKSVFLGHRTTFDFAERELRLSSRETGEEVALRHFTPLQVVASLHHKVLSGYQRRKRYVRKTRQDAEDRLNDEETFRSNMNLIVFSGDSMNREFFLRLVFHIRFGMDPPRGNPYLRQTPFHEPSQQHDMIYSVYEDHDELEVYHSQMSNGKSRRTVSSFFQQLKWDVRRWERFPSSRTSGAKPNVALFYVVYFWDPQTDFYRREMLPDLRMLDNVLHSWEEHIINATESPHDVAAGRGYLRISPTHQNAKRMQDSNEIAMLVPGQPCMVRLRLANGAEKRVDLSQQVSSSVIPGGGVVIRGGGRMIQDLRGPQPRRTANRQGYCPPDRAAAALRIRDTFLARHRQRYSPKPPSPLRDFGLRVAVHVQGNVFWEYVRNVQMTQHMYAALVATDDDLSELPQLPRRASPKDQTELYMFSSSFQENLQPYLRGLSPFYQRIHGRRLVVIGGPSRVSNESLSEAGGADLKEDSRDEDNGDALDELVAAAGVSERSGSLSPTIGVGHGSGGLVASSNRSTKLSSKLFQYFQEKLPGQSIHALLKQYKLAKETHHNLIKNVQQLLWFESARNVRESIQSDARKRALEQGMENPLRSPFRYIDSMTLLEMGKLQFLGFAQGDSRHFSCRYTQVKDRIRFGSSFESFGIRNVLSLGSFANNTEKRLCTTYRSDTRREGQGQQRKASVEDLVEAFARMLSPSGVRQHLWRVSGMEEIDRLFGPYDPMSFPEKIMHFHDYKEYGVIVHDDDDRCVDEGNLLLLEVLLSKMVLRDADHPQGN